jgi:hypothetical protein
MPIGGPNGGPLRVTLTRQQLDDLGEDLFRRARLPLDAACWQAGVDLNEAMMALQEKREDLARRGVPEWKREMVSGLAAAAARASPAQLGQGCCRCCRVLAPARAGRAGG